MLTPTKKHNQKICAICKRPTDPSDRIAFGGQFYHAHTCWAQCEEYVRRGKSIVLRISLDDAEALLDFIDRIKLDSLPIPVQRVYAKAVYAVREMGEFFIPCKHCGEMIRYKDAFESVHTREALNELQRMPISRMPGMRVNKQQLSRILFFCNEECDKAKAQTLREMLKTFKETIEQAILDSSNSNDSSDTVEIVCGEHADPSDPSLSCGC